MFGAILGDIIGSPYEHNDRFKQKDFPLFNEACVFTDDTVMTIAVADALMEITPDMPDEAILSRITGMLRWHGQRHPNAGYGGAFRRWLKSVHPKPYGSYGNGSAMRVSSAGWLFDDLETVRRMARLSAMVTHDHPEGIKGAEAVASAIFLARTGKNKDEIRRYVEEQFQYDLRWSCDELRPFMYFDVTCQGTVPPAMMAFLEGKNLEDTIRCAVSLGGDTDTLGAIAGSMAESYWGVSEEFRLKAYAYLTVDLGKVLGQFEQQMRNQGKFREETAE